MSRLVSSSLRVSAWRFSISNSYRRERSDFHGQFAILVLAAFVLALHDDAGGQVRDAHRGFHLVHVLAARAAGAEGVDAHFLGLHDNLDSIVNFRNDEDRGEGSMAPRGLIERGNPNQAVHAALGGEKSEGVLAFDAHRRGFESRAFARRQIHDRRAKSFAFRPAEIHAQQHFGPILRFHAARAGLDGHDGVQAVVLTGEQRERLQFGDIGVGGGDFALDFVEQRVALGRRRFLPRQDENTSRYR